MYTLRVKEHLDHPDGRIFEPGHDCNALDAFEVAELVVDYPDHFEAADEVTGALIADAENMQHLAAAVKARQQ